MKDTFEIVGLKPSQWVKLCEFGEVERLDKNTVNVTCEHVYEEDLTNWFEEQGLDWRLV